MERPARLTPSCGLHLLLVFPSNVDHGIAKDQLTLEPSFQEPQPSMTESGRASKRCSCQSAWWWQTDSRNVSPSRRSRKLKQKPLCMLGMVLLLSLAAVQDCWLSDYISAHASLLSVVFWICHDTVEIFVIFWLQKRFTAMNNPPVSEQAESLLLSSSSECKWEALQSLRNACWSEAQDVLAYSRKDSIRLIYLFIFPSKMEETIYEAITEIFIAVRHHSISCSERFVCFKNTLGCSSAA